MELEEGGDLFDDSAFPEFLAGFACETTGGEAVELPAPPIPPSVVHSAAIS